MKYAAILLLLLFCLQTRAQHRKNPTGQVRLNVKPLPVELVHRAPGFAPATLDTAVDLSPYAPVIAQQPFKNCYAYASVYAGRTILYNILHGYTNKPDSTIFSAAFLERIFYSDQSACQSAGYDTREACRLLQDTGAVFRHDFPEECTTNPIPAALWQKAAANRIKVHNLYEPCSPAADKVRAIKEALAAHRPVVLGWNSVASFNGGGYNRDLWAPTRWNRWFNSCSTAADHAICVVAYSDNRYGGAFRIMNSWSTDWGKGGMIWIRYSDLADFSEFGIELSDQ
jgi:hypothetical protein